MVTPRSWTLKSVKVTNAQHDALWSAIDHLDNEQAGRDDERGNQMRRELTSLRRLYEKLNPI